MQQNQDCTEAKYTDGDPAAAWKLGVWPGRRRVGESGWGTMGVSVGEQSEAAAIWEEVAMADIVSASTVTICPWERKGLPIPKGLRR